jgi:hypothetical protein
MIKTSGALRLHKKHTKDLIRNSTQELIVRLPVELVSSNVNVLYGDFERETDSTGTEYGPFPCLWYDALSARSLSSTGTGFEPTVQSLVGQYRDATAFAELWLEDVLVDPKDISGDTWLDRAKEIVNENKRFQLLGNVRLGIATTTPYILMVVLKGGVGYVD